MAWSSGRAFRTRRRRSASSASHHRGRRCRGPGCATAHRSGWRLRRARHRHPLFLDTLDQRGAHFLTGTDEQSPDRRHVGAVCRQALGSFIREGRPHGDLLRDWPRFDRAGQQIAVLDVEPAVVRDPHQARLDLWESVPLLGPLFTPYNAPDSRSERTLHPADQEAA